MDEYTQKHIGGEVHNNGQVAHTLVFTEFGYDVYDIREKYRVLHSMGSNENDHFFELYFSWNEPHLIVPSKVQLWEEVIYITKNEPQFQLPGLNNKYLNKI